MQATQKVAVPATLRGVVERAFYYQGKPTKVGEEVTLPRIFALEMEAVKKLRLIKEPAKPAPTVASKDAEAEGKKEKETRHAR